MFYKHISSCTNVYIYIIILLNMYTFVYPSNMCTAVYMYIIILIYGKISIYDFIYAFNSFLWSRVSIHVYIHNICDMLK